MLEYKWNESSSFHSPPINVYNFPPDGYSFGVSIAIIFSIINISISDKCACICLHQYLYIFHIKTHNLIWWGNGEETRVDFHSSISRSDFNYRCISCAFFCAIILRHFDGKCWNLLNTLVIYVSAAQAMWDFRNDTIQRAGLNLQTKVQILRDMKLSWLSGNIVKGRKTDWLVERV